MTDVANTPAPGTADFYVPGLWECNECGFTLLQRRMSAVDGSIGDDDRPGGKCPNCNLLMSRMSWRSHSHTIEAQLISALGERQALEAQIEELKCLLIGRPAERRKWYIGQILGTQGHLNRLDIMELFGISQAIVSKDIAEWMAENPGMMTYNASRKRYEAAPAGGAHDDA